MSGSLSGAEGFTTQEDQEVINRVEKQLKRRFAIGSQVIKDSTSFELICLNADSKDYVSENDFKNSNLYIHDFLGE